MRRYLLPGEALPDGAIILRASAVTNLAQWVRVRRRALKSAAGEIAQSLHKLQDPLELI